MTIQVDVMLTAGHTHHERKDDLCVCVCVRARAYVFVVVFFGLFLTRYNQKRLLYTTDQMNQQDTTAETPGRYLRDKQSALIQSTSRKLKAPLGKKKDARTRIIK